jgi:acetyl-CoA carboxylase biotin carboxylase subunit
MIAKLVCWGRDREEAISRSIRALREYRVRGIRTSIPFFAALLRDPDFAAGSYNTGFLSPDRLARLSEATRNDRVATIAAALARFEADETPARVATTGAARSAWRRGSWR